MSVASVFQVKTQKWGWMLRSGAARKSDLTLKGRKRGHRVGRERQSLQRWCSQAKGKGVTVEVGWKEEHRK